MKIRYSVARCCCDAPPPVVSPASYGNWDINGTFVGNNTIPRVGIEGEQALAVHRTYSGYALFSQVPIPQGATVTTASLEQPAGANCRAGICTAPPTEPVVLGPGSSGPQCNFSQENVRVRIRGEAIDNASEYTSVAAINAAARTTALVDLTLPGAANASGAGAAFVQDQTGVFANIPAIITEIVGRPGWAPGNSLQIFLDDNGSYGGSTNVPVPQGYGALWFIDQVGDPLPFIMNLAWT